MIVPEQFNAVLEDQELANGKYLVLKYLHNVQHKVLVVPLEWLEKSRYSNGLTINGISHRNGSVQRYQNVITREPGELVGLPGAEELDLPVGCAVTNITCRDDNNFVFIQLNGFTQPGCIYKYEFYNIDTSSTVNRVTYDGLNKIASHSLQNPYGQLSIWRQSIVDGFRPDHWTVEQVWVANPNDRVKIPMYIVRDKSLIKNGNSFCLLYGYHA